MSLGTRIGLYLLIAVTVYGVLDYSIQRWVILPSFEKLERRDAAENLDRCASAIQRELKHLDIFCRDWSAWDDSYAFIVSGNPEYIKANLIDLTFTDNRLSLIFFVDIHGKVVWGRFFDLEQNKPAELDKFPPSSWALNNPLLQHKSEDSSLSGILLTRAGAMLVVSRPIITTLNMGPIRGSLIMGRLLDNTLITSIAEQIKAAVEIKPIVENWLSPEDLDHLSALTPEHPYHYAEHGMRNLHVCTTYAGMDGKPVLWIQATINRYIMAQGMDTVWMARLSMVVIGLLVFLVVLLSIRFSVTKPLAHLTGHVTRVTKEEDLASLELPPRRDEIGLLTREFNHMVRRIQNDNAERRQAEKALREQETWIHTVLDTAPDGIVTIDENGLLKTVNPAFERLFGYTAQEMIGRSLTDFIPVALEKKPEGTEEATHTVVETIGHHKKGGMVPLLWTQSEATISGKRVFIGIVRDITEFKAMHDKVLRAEHLAALGEMGASVAHEVRNPLAGISSAAQVLRETLPPDDSRREVIQEMLDEVARVETIIRRLLMLAKSWAPAKEPINAFLLAARISREARERPPWEHIEFLFEGSDTLSIFADPALIEQVFWNILQNAADALAAQTAPKRIAWRFENLAGGARIVIKDNGCGMPQEIVDRLFNPFFTTKTYGTGLGLLICQRIVEAHGGTISAASLPGEGTEIIVVLPQGEQA
ncbi:MAG TPA: CHASE4 domain-containing protein [Candidatus Hydrogenedentes bacterium]|nr:CHASE4 domain-containing protein [Candidatus Hydrogenedentota bacterium]